MNFFFWLIIPCKVPFRIKTNYKNFYYGLLEHIFSEIIRLSCPWVINFVLEIQKSSGYWKWTSIRSESAGYERKQEFDFYLSKIISNSKCWYTLITKERWSLFDLVPSNTKGDHGLPKGRNGWRQRGRKKGSGGLLLWESRLCGPGILGIFSSFWAALRKFDLCVASRFWRWDSILVTLYFQKRLWMCPSSFCHCCHYVRKVTSWDHHKQIF